MAPIHTLLIANRGEIAVRIARTCRELGIATVAVFSEPDASALHVRACDQAVALGGASPTESYLRVEALLDAARRTGADAVHPGYGFLAENADFARAVTQAGLTWVGPSPDAIAAMGDKLEAKRRMAAAGVPVLASVAIDDDGHGAADVAAILDEVGLPLMVKAAAGGGGKGMRIVERADDLPDAIAAAQREAVGAFGDGRVFCERYVARPRHLEVQILGDQHGTLLHLGERECSIQRRHQKVVEESPSVALTDQLRGQLCDAAVAAGAAIGYTNAGTVEFVAEDSGGQVTGFHFLEVNTRLQVEHPVTEAVTGRDLVRLQLLVAQGEALPFTQADVTSDGHAIEVRLYAEDPAGEYLPQTGRLHALQPADVPGVRWDTGIEAGSEVSPHYDPMLAKVIAHAPTRMEAAARLATALERTLLHGTPTNRDLLVAVLRDQRFLAGATTTGFLGERFPGPEDRTFAADPSLVAQALLVETVVAAAVRANGRRVLASVTPAFTNDPHARRQTSYTAAGEAHTVAYRMQRDGTVQLWLDGAASPAIARTVGQVGEDEATVELDGLRLPVRRSTHGAERHLVLPAGHVTLLQVPRFPVHRGEEVAGATLAPMPGAVVEVAVAEGDDVQRGQLLVAVEAMKMEHRITAPFDGTVSEVRVASGQQVAADDVLVVVDARDDGDPAAD